MTSLPSPVQVSPSRRSRAPNGAADKRLRVALPAEILERVVRDANEAKRTLSSTAALIIAQHYATGDGEKHA